MTVPYARKKPKKVEYEIEEVSLTPSEKAKQIVSFLRGKRREPFKTESRETMTVVTSQQEAKEVKLETVEHPTKEPITRFSTPDLLVRDLAKKPRPPLQVVDLSPKPEAQALLDKLKIEPRISSKIKTQITSKDLGLVLVRRPPKEYEPPESLVEGWSPKVLSGKVKVVDLRSKVRHYQESPV